jgi:hypothetical protein
MGEHHRITIHHCGVSTTMSDNYQSFNASFMLAIAEAREAGAKAERERIIKLLEDNDHLSHICADRFIALIKGEQK